MSHVIILCYSCGRMLVAKADSKTRLCPYCGARVVLGKAKKLAFASSASEASEKLRVLNMLKRES